MKSARNIEYLNKHINILNYCNIILMPFRAIKLIYFIYLFTKLTNMNTICQRLKINESLFEGNPLPDTIEDVFIFFFSTEEIDGNNIPMHIPRLLQYIRENPRSTDEEKISNCEIFWITHEIKFQLNRIDGIDERTLNNDDKEAYFKLKIDCLYNIFSILIDNFDIYKRMGQRFITISRLKIDDIFSLLRSGKISIQDPVYKKAMTLNGIARRGGLWE